jgi:hypothetical protein
MNKSVFRITCGKDLDDNGFPTEIIDVVYCESQTEAQMIFEFMADGIGKDIFLMVDEIPLTTFNEYFNDYVGNNFGGSYNKNDVN